MQNVAMSIDRIYAEFMPRIDEATNTDLKVICPIRKSFSNGLKDSGILAGSGGIHCSMPDSSLEKVNRYKLRC